MLTEQSLLKQNWLINDHCACSCYENDASCDYKTSCESIRLQKVASNTSYRFTDVQCYLNHLFEHICLFYTEVSKKR